MKKIKRVLIAAALIVFGSLSCFGLDWYNPVEDVRMETSNDWEDWTVYIDGIKDDWFYHVDKTLSTSMRSETVEVDFITFDKIFNEDLSHYTFFIDNTIPYINVDPDLYVNKIPLTEEEKKREV